MTIIRAPEPHFTGGPAGDMPTHPLLAQGPAPTLCSLKQALNTPGRRPWTWGAWRGHPFIPKAVVSGIGISGGGGCVPGSGWRGQSTACGSGEGTWRDHAQWEPVDQWCLNKTPVCIQTATGPAQASRWGQVWWARLHVPGATVGPETCWEESCQGPPDGGLRGLGGRGRAGGRGVDKCVWA